ncbi:MAG: hypothetical protein ACFFD4_39450, partial [Candidatus Odinarchaeota archaeon]
MKPLKKIDITQDVLQKVEQGQVNMRAHWTFVARKIGIDSGIVLGLAVMVLGLSFGFALWQQYSVSHLLSLGLWGWKKVLLCFPFEIIGIVVLALLLINYLIKKTDWGYKRTWRFWSLLILAVIVPLSLVISGLYSTQRSHQTKRDVQSSGLQAYAESRMQALGKSFVEGTITTMSEHTLTITDTEQRVYTVNRSEIQLKPRYYTPSQGDRVALLGEWKD